MPTVLIVEDDQTLRYSLRVDLGDQGWTCVEASTVAEAERALDSVEPDLVLLDLHLAGGDGMHVLDTIRKDAPEVGVVMMTAFGSVDSAVDAMKRGADEYLQKPVSLDELRVITERLLARKQMQKKLNLYERLNDGLSEAEPEPLGESPAWRVVLETARKMAEVPDRLGETLPVILLCAETGAGKGVIARYIHDHGAAADAPFVHVNCSALAASLIEDELFGHEAGAYTDAKGTRHGLFEISDGGTIFLDEIGDMPLELQAKLLLVVEQGVFRRLGSSRERRVNARIIAATNQDLHQRAEDGLFRRDLLFRLNALSINLPTLRERGEDALLIADKTLERLSTQFRRPALRLSPSARDAILRYSWPGNVRELLNVLQRAVLLSETSTLDASDLRLTDSMHPGSLSTDPSSDASDDDHSRHDGAGPLHPEGLYFDFANEICTLEAVERQLVQQAMEHCNGNLSRAARLLGLSRSSLRLRLSRHNIEWVTVARSASSGSSDDE